MHYLPIIGLLFGIKNNSNYIAYQFACCVVAFVLLVRWVFKN